MSPIFSEKTLYKPLLQGQAHQADRVLHAELVQKTFAVPVDGLLAQMQLVGNLWVRHPFRRFYVDSKRYNTPHGRLRRLALMLLLRYVKVCELYLKISEKF